MKKLVIILSVVVLSTILCSKVSAQNPIPSFNVPVIADPTTFEESPFTKTFVSSTQTHSIPFNKNSGTRERRKLYVIINDNSASTTAEVIINIYSLDGSLVLGPYTVTEDETFSLNLDETLTWGVKVLNASEGCEMDVWFE